eukprot:4096982-Amphidinium_carterae.2
MWHVGLGVDSASFDDVVDDDDDDGDDDDDDDGDGDGYGDGGNANRLDLQTNPAKNDCRPKQD